MLNAGLTQGVVATSFLVFGAARMMALYANGRLPIYGPAARALGALGGAVMWVQLCTALAGMTPITGQVSLGVPVYLALAAGELVSCFRAVRDGRRYSDR
jgi:hypothetical protein